MILSTMRLQLAYLRPGSWTDWAGLTIGRVPKFVKQYANLAEILSDAAKEWRADVEAGDYPNSEHSYE